MYNVVFEYTEKAGGFAGVRIRTSYASKEEFERLSATDDTLLTVIDEGISDQEAQWLTSETREVCRVKAAIEEAFQSGEFNAKLFQVYFHNAKDAILHDRQSNYHGSCTLCFIAFLPFEEMSTASDKELLFAVVDACSDPETGQVDLEFLPLYLASAILAILTR